MNILNIWQTNLIAYLICVTFFYHYYKVAVNKSKNETAATIVLQIVGGMVAFLLIPLAPWSLPSDPKIYLLLILASVFYAINNRLQTTVRKHLEVSTFSIMNQLTQVFMIIISLSLFEEKDISHKLLGAGLILSGNTLLMLKSGNLKLNKYMILSVLSTLSAAIGVSLSIGIAKKFNLPLYVGLTFLIPALMLKLTSKTEVSSIIYEYKKSNKKYLTTGLFWTLSIIFSLNALTLGQVSTIVPLQATTILINVSIAYLVYKEKNLAFRKLVAASFVVLGVIAQTR